MNRLEEIKERYSAGLDRDRDSLPNIVWLIAEIERLREEADTTFVNAAHDAIARADKAEAELDNEWEASRFLQAKLDQAEARVREQDIVISEFLADDYG